MKILINSILTLSLICFSSTGFAIDLSQTETNEEMPRTNVTSNKTTVDQRNDVSEIVRVINQNTFDSPSQEEKAEYPIPPFRERSAPDSSSEISNRPTVNPGIPDGYFDNYTDEELVTALEMTRPRIVLHVDNPVQVTDLNGIPVDDEYRRVLERERNRRVLAAMEEMISQMQEMMDQLF